MPGLLMVVISGAHPDTCFEKFDRLPDRAKASADAHARAVVALAAIASVRVPVLFDTQTPVSVDGKFTGFVQRDGSIGR